MPLKQTEPETAAMILSGGGAFAAYEIGVMCALFSGRSPATDFKPLKPTVMAGTSSGAFNAAFVCSVPESDSASAADSLAEIWLHEIADQADDCGNGVYRFRMNLWEGFGPDCISPNVVSQWKRIADDSAEVARDLVKREIQFLDSSASWEKRLFEAIDLSSVISTEPYAKTLQRTIQLNRIRSSPLRLIVGTTNWETGEFRQFVNEDMSEEQGYDILRASAGLPGIFHSVDIDGEPYVDGGVVVNTPLKGAIDEGASVLHTVYINPDVSRIPLPRLRSTLGSLLRAFVISLATNANSDVETAREINREIRQQNLVRSEDYRLLTIHRYHPQKLYGGIWRWLNFERDHVLELIQRGFAETIEHDCVANGCVLPNEVLASHA